MLRPVGRQRVAEEIVGQLRTLILKGTYAPGQKLPPERRLAVELGVNRASLREAIKALEQMGLVKTRQGDGTRVLDFMQTAGVELVSHLVLPVDGKPDLGVLADVLEFRRLFGREVARLSAERATPAELANLGELAERAAHAATDEEVLQLDFEFYVTMTNASKNRVLQLLINTIRSAVAHYAGFFASFNPPAAVVRKHHRDLVKAIEAKDGDRAAQVADTFLRRGAEQLLAALGPAKTP